MNSDPDRRLLCVQVDRGAEGALLLEEQHRERLRYFLCKPHRPPDPRFEPQRARFRGTQADKGSDPHAHLSKPITH